MFLKKRTKKRSNVQPTCQAVHYFVLFFFGVDVAFAESKQTYKKFEKGSV